MSCFTVQLLKISNKENYYRCKVLMDIAVSCAALYLCRGSLPDKLTGHLLFLFWISASACQLFTLHQDRNCSFLFYETSFLKKGYFHITAVSLLESVILFIANLLIFAVDFQGKTEAKFITALVHFLFALFLGELAGILGKKRAWGLLALALFYLGIFYVSTSWTQAELFRPVSPILQLYNMERLNWTNLIFLSLLTAVFFLLGAAFFHRGNRKRNSVYLLVCLCGLLTYSAVFLYEIQANRNVSRMEWRESGRIENIRLYTRALPEEDGEFFGKIVQDMQEQAGKFGFGKPVEEIQAQRYYISLLPFYRSRSIPFLLTEHQLQINVISDAMLNWQDESLASNLLFRCYGQLYLNQSSENSYADKVRNICQYYIIYQTVQEGKNGSYSRELQELMKKYCDQTYRYMGMNGDLCTNLTITMLEKDPQLIKDFYLLLIRENPPDEKSFQNLVEDTCPELVKETDAHRNGEDTVNQ